MVHLNDFLVSDVAKSPAVLLTCWSSTTWFRLLVLLMQLKHWSEPQLWQMQGLASPTRYPSHPQASLSPTASTFCPGDGVTAVPIGFTPCWWRHDARSTVSHFPVGLKHLDNTIETDRLSLFLLECVGGTKIGCWLFTLCQCTVVPPRRDKRAAMFCHSAVLSHGQRRTTWQIDHVTFLV